MVDLAGKTKNQALICSEGFFAQAEELEAETKEETKSNGLKSLTDLCLFFFFLVWPFLSLGCWVRHGVSHVFIYDFQE